jgi:ATP-dependent protease ClpP protease subunit
MPKNLTTKYTAFEFPRLDDDDDDDDSSGLIRRHNNVIYYFTDVCADNILTLFNKLQEGREYCIANNIKELYIHFQSEGGCLFSGLNAMEYIANVKDVEVIGVVCGCVASAATLMLLGCSYLQMYEYSFVLIHQLSTSMDFGKFNELKDELKNSEKMNESLKRIYKKYTGLTDKKLEELFSKEMYMDSAECLKFGIVNEVF